MCIFLFFFFFNCNPIHNPNEGTAKNQIVFDGLGSKWSTCPSPITYKLYPKNNIQLKPIWLGNAKQYSPINKPSKLTSETEKKFRRFDVKGVRNAYPSVT